MDQGFRTTRGEYTAARERNWDSVNNEQGAYLYSASMVVGEERGYVLGVEDERRKFRERMRKIISNLKARGYPLKEIAEDTGYSLEEIRII
ncbi:MAG: hypothetical protein FWD78_12375 [Treponema sp.]|nr:hypothetical protein [Treponema sp.]